jgi:hypothetical protein
MGRKRKKMNLLPPHTKIKLKAPMIKERMILILQPKIVTKSIKSSS